MKDVIRRGDQASELARSLARLMTAGVLALAIFREQVRTHVLKNSREVTAMARNYRPEQGGRIPPVSPTCVIFRVV